MNLFEYSQVCAKDAYGVRSETLKIARDKLLKECGGFKGIVYRSCETPCLTYELEPTRSASEKDAFEKSLHGARCLLAADLRSAGEKNLIPCMLLALQVVFSGFTSKSGPQALRPYFAADVIDEKKEYNDEFEFEVFEI